MLESRIMKSVGNFNYALVSNFYKKLGYDVKIMLINPA